MVITRLKITDAIRQDAHRLTGEATDYDPLMDMVGDARFVLIGEATHGTHEFYQQRAEITKRLIGEKGFSAIAVEADWPDAYRINRYVRNASDDREAIDSLGNFERFPTWMWRNADVLDFIGWLRQFNDRLPSNAVKVGFYGLDLYSLYSSIEAVLKYLDLIDPEAAARARQRYGCFEHFGENVQEYGYATSFGLSEPCENEVINQLVDMQRRAADYAGRDGRVPEDEFFFAEQNARLVRNAEEYYRSMFRGRISSWNLRDRHMAETLDNLAHHLSDRQGSLAKIVVWEHNSHLGDARATDMGAAGELNVGQLIRQRYNDDAVLVGLTTNTGTVTAASSWGETAERKRVRPALPNSYEGLFRDSELSRFFLDLRQDSDAVSELRAPRLERAIGVIYLPQTERASHYFNTKLPNQFDAVIHFDETRALEPLERTPIWERGEAPETFPYGL